MNTDPPKQTDLSANVEEHTQCNQANHSTTYLTINTTSLHGQVHCLVEHGAVLERADNAGARGSERASGCQNPALVASVLKKGSKTGTEQLFTSILQ